MEKDKKSIEDFILHTKNVMDFQKGCAKPMDKWMIVDDDCNVTMLHVDSICVCRENVVVHVVDKVVKENAYETDKEMVFNFHKDAIIICDSLKEAQVKHEAYKMWLKDREFDAYIGLEYFCKAMEATEGKMDFEPFHLVELCKGDRAKYIYDAFMEVDDKRCELMHNKS